MTATTKCSSIGHAIKQAVADDIQRVVRCRRCGARFEPVGTNAKADR